MRTPERHRPTVAPPIEPDIPPMPIFPDLRGKVAVVTGASRRLGAEVARQFAANAMKVVVSGRDEVALGRVAEGIRADGGRVLAVAADCTSPAALADLRQRVEWEWGAVDVVAAIAGGNGTPRPSAQLSLGDWQAAMDANLTGTFLTIQAFLPGMLDRRRGAVVTMASSAGRQPSLASAAYGTAKAGVVMLTRHLAREYGPQGVRFNCLAPAALLTERLSSLTAEQRFAIAAQFPLGRIGLPEDVAHAALFLASDTSSWISGVTLDLAGGWFGNQP